MMTTRVGVAGVDEIRNCFVFKVPSDGVQRVKRFRDPVALRILSEVARSLASKGFKVTSVKPGKACDGGFKIQFERSCVEVLVAAERHGDFVDVVATRKCRINCNETLSPPVD
jgi:hypothetical protein